MLASPVSSLRCSTSKKVMLILPLRMSGSETLSHICWGGERPSRLLLLTATPVAVAVATAAAAVATTTICMAVPAIAAATKPPTFDAAALAATPEAAELAAD